MGQHVHIFVYQKGDIVKDPMKSISFVPKPIPGVVWGGWVMQGWGGVGHGGVGWVI